MSALGCPRARRPSGPGSTLSPLRPLQAAHPRRDEGTLKQHTYQIRFAAPLTENGVGPLEASRV
jgi:hypothetical protein